MFSGVVLMNCRDGLCAIDLRNAELAQHKSRCAEIYDSLPTGFVTLDKSCNIIQINFAGAQLLQKVSHDLCGEQFLSYVMEADQHTLAETVQRVFLTQVPQICEFSLRPNGDQPQQSLQMVASISADRMECRAVLHDITEHRLIENSLTKTNKDLAAREAWLNVILDTSIVAIFMVDREGRISEANRCMASMFGLSLDALIGMEYIDLVQSHERTTGNQSMQALLANEVPHVDVERQYARADGTEFWGHLTGNIFYDAHGVQRGLVGMIVDINSRKQGEGKLKLAANVFAHAREGITITDPTGTIIEVNDTFTLITGYSREEVLGQNSRILHSGRQLPAFYTAMWRDLITTTGSWSGEIWNQHKCGEVYAAMLTISAVRDAAGTTQHYVGIFSDITPMKQHQGQLEHIAHHDALTNFPNRVLLADRLQQGLIQSQRRNKLLAVAYLDLDNFKDINDLHGHDVGDALLIEVSQRMKDALREGDTLARIGGDEFVAVIVDLLLPEECSPVLERLLHAAAMPVSVPVQSGGADLVLQVSASIGVTVYPQDGTDADQLLRHADQAMYLAKQAGKNRHHMFDVARDAAIQTTHESLAHIRNALRNNEFELFYQPKVNMTNGRVIGVEALIRWQHSEQGLLAPAAFLPLIENHPLSLEVGEWVIETALAQMSRWRDHGLIFPVSVNISAFQLKQGNFVTRLHSLLLAHPDIPPDCLELEVLETSALGDIGHASGVINSCQALGVRFSLDDFGTGYSSLTYLRHLPVDVLKIDRSFVRDMIHDQDDLAIVKGIIGLAAAFRRDVIAEGVESVEHGKLLDCASNARRRNDGVG
jgi:diguanylate cyclase (GGDEF)-like protein/PAS domain S-box-containing protein